MDIIVLRTFVSILDEGSFAAAARRMGISRSLASKYISDLEDSLGARLLTRTTRTVRPTTVGEAYGVQLRDVLGRLDAAHEGVRNAVGQAAGTLKIGSPVAYTLQVLQPHLRRFMETYPDIQLELLLEDGASDIIGDGFDAVIRVGHLADSSLHARRLHQGKIMLVATPDYIEKFGLPLLPADLKDHKCLHYTNLRTGDSWSFQRDGETIHQKIQPILASNNGDLLYRMALDGMGVTLLPEFIVEEDLRAGRLISLLPEYTMPHVPISILFPTGKLMTAAMRSFLDFMGDLRLD